MTDSDDSQAAMRWLTRHWHVFVTLAAWVMAIVLLFPRVEAIENKVDQATTRETMRAEFKIRDFKINELDDDISEIKSDVKVNTKMLQEILQRLPK